VNDVVRHKLVRKILSIYDTETALKLQTKQ